MVDAFGGDRSPDTSPALLKEVSEEPRRGRPLLLTVQDAAKYIGIGRTTLYRLMQEGAIASVRVGASRRIPLSSAHAFVDGLCESTTTDLEEKGD